MLNLDTFQRKVAGLLIGMSVVHVPLIALLCIYTGFDALPVTLAAAAAVLMPAVLYGLGRPLTVVGFALALTLVGQASLLVAAFTGHPWQIEMHFYYFAVLALLAGFCDWRVTMTGAALIAAHHLTLNMLLPAALQPGGTSLPRVLVHALVVVIEAGGLMLTGWAIRGAFAAADRARKEAEALTTQLEQVGAEREKALAVTSRRADHLDDTMVRFRSEVMERIDHLHRASDVLKRSASQMSTVATRAMDRSALVSSSADEASGQVEHVAVAGQAFASTIAEIGRNAARSSGAAQAAVEQARVTDASIAELAQVSEEIGNVNALIATIAGQTNLLALNATIEAARAGEQGRGFAIVAQEVKELALQSAQASHTVTNRIAAIQAATRRSVSAIQSITEAVHGLRGFAESIASSVEEQTRAAGEIAGNVTAAAQSVSSLAELICEIEAIADDTASAATELDGSAHSIAEQAHGIRERVLAFTGEQRMPEQRKAA